MSLNQTAILLFYWRNKKKEPGLIAVLGGKMPDADLYSFLYTGRLSIHSHNRYDRNKCSIQTPYRSVPRGKVLHAPCTTGYSVLVLKTTQFLNKGGSHLIKRYQTLFFIHIMMMVIDDIRSG